MVADAARHYALSMAAEIERKFLLPEPPHWPPSSSQIQIEQGYVAVGKEGEVRLRRAGEQRLLTVKHGEGEVREEVEVDLDEGQFEALWPLTESRRLRKVRHLVPLGSGLDAEVDVYEDGLEGLVTAEVEFGSKAQSADFQSPAWLGEEVTGDARYANRNLVLHGRPGCLASAKTGSNGGVSRAYRLKTKETPPAGMRRIALGRVDSAMDRLAGDGDEDFAVAIHGSRKDLKKLRALLRLIRKELGEELFQAENRSYRDAGRLLAGSRDAEVRLETLRALRSRYGAELTGDAAERWEEALERKRNEMTAAADESTGEIEEAVQTIEAGRGRISEWPLKTDSWKLVAPGLATAYAKGRRAMKRTLTDPSAENVHEWRKRAKDLWYQLRIVREAWPGLLEAAADQAHELTDLLGDHHDLAVLREDLASRDGDTQKTFEPLMLRRQEELLDSALELGRRLYAEKPKAFRRRLKRYWLAWRHA